MIGVVTFWRPSASEDEEESGGTLLPLSQQVFSRWRQKSTPEITDTSDIVEQGHKIHKLMSLSGQKLEASRSSDEWRAYVEYVNGIVSRGVHAAITSALDYLIRNMSVRGSFLAVLRCECHRCAVSSLLD